MYTRRRLTTTQIKYVVKNLLQHRMEDKVQTNNKQITYYSDL